MSPKSDALTALAWEIVREAVQPRRRRDGTAMAWRRRLAGLVRWRARQRRLSFNSRATLRALTERFSAEITAKQPE